MTQAPAVTTWATPPLFKSQVYTVTFAAVPDQWPSPGVGSIGLGTLQQKRDVTPAAAAVAPQDTGIAGRVHVGEQS